jgi:hypothetical protein
MSMGWVAELFQAARVRRWLRNPASCEIMEKDRPASLRSDSEETGIFA